MHERHKMIRWQTSAGEPVVVATTTITPMALSLIVQLPFGGFVWSRPIALELKNGTSTRRLPIVDMTRAIQAAILIAAMGLWLLGARQQGRK